VTIDIISDIHLDFYAKDNIEDINSFVENLISTKTDKNFDVLVIAGDIGHYNDDNIYFLELISKLYKKVFVTWGNHDLYLLPDQAGKYEYNSFNRLNELKEKVKELNNVIFLDGEKIEYEDITFWGSGLWYDVLDINHWANYMNDAGLIFDRREPYKIIMSYELYATKFNFNTNRLYKKEYAKVKQLDKANVIISHIPPVSFNFSGNMGDNYYFVPYGEEIIEKVKPKMWIFGHIHTKRDKKFNGCRLICNPLGYPDENRDFKIKSMKI